MSRRLTIVLVAIAVAALLPGCALAPAADGGCRNGEMAGVLDALGSRGGDLVSPSRALAAAAGCAEGRPIGIGLAARPAVGGSSLVWEVEILGDDRFVDVRVDSRTSGILGWDAGDLESDAETEKAAVAEDLLAAARLDLGAALAALAENVAGSVLAVELDAEHGSPVYVAKILRDGCVRRIVMDAQTGKVVPRAFDD